MPFNRADHLMVGVEGGQDEENDRKSGTDQQ